MVHQRGLSACASGRTMWQQVMDKSREGVKSTDLGKTPGFKASAAPLASCMVLDELLSLSVPIFSSDNGVCLMG